MPSNQDLVERRIMKMQKYILKQQFEGFFASNTEGLHKGYDRFQSLLSQLEIHGAGVSIEDANQKFLRSLPSAWSQVSLIMRTKPGVDSLSFDDLYNNLRVFESDIKGSIASFSSPQNVAFVSENTSIALNDHEDLEQLVNKDLKEMDFLNSGKSAMFSMRMKCLQKRLVEKKAYNFDAKETVWIGTKSFEDKILLLMDCNSSDSDYKVFKKVEAQLVAHQQGQLWYEQKIKFMKIDLDDKTDVLTYHKKLLAEAQKEKEDLKAKVEKWHNSSKNLSKLLNTQMSANDKFGLGYGDHRYDGILSYENEVLQSVFMNKESEIENQPLYDRFVPDVEVDDSKFTYGPKQTQPNESESQSSEFDTCESNISVEPSKLVSEPVVNESNVECQPKVWSDAPIIEEYELDSDDECVSIPIKQQETPSFANKPTELRTDFTKQKVNTAKADSSPNRLGSLRETNLFLLNVHDCPHRALKNKGIVDSGCSRHMTGNKAYLAEFQV
ncbi:hypothetical protein Tco_0344049 [Tanacetum coccineum]